MRLQNKVEKVEEFSFLENERTLRKKENRAKNATSACRCSVIQKSVSDIPLDFSEEIKTLMIKYQVFQNCEIAFDEKLVFTWIKMRSLLTDNTKPQKRTRIISDSNYLTNDNVPVSVLSRTCYQYFHIIYNDLWFSFTLNRFLFRPVDAKIRAYCNLSQKQKQCSTIKSLLLGVSWISHDFVFQAVLFEFLLFYFYH